MTVTVEQTQEADGWALNNIMLKFEDDSLMECTDAAGDHVGFIYMSNNSPEIFNCVPVV